MQPFYQTHESAIEFSTGDRLQYAMHMHREIELYYLIDGCNTVNFSGIEHTMTSGEIAIAFPNEPHSYHGDNNAKHLVFIADPDLCPDFSSVFRHYRPEFPFLKTEETSPDLRAVLNILIAMKKDPVPDTKLLKGYLTVILFRIMEQLPLISEQKITKRDLTSKVIYHLMQNYQNSISLESVAEALRVSKYEVSRIFSKQIKMGFNQYLNRMRLEQAVHQLISTEHSVTEIAFSCGFESLRTFYRVFAEQYKVSPLQYRRENMTNYRNETESEDLI